MCVCVCDQIVLIDTWCLLTLSSNHLSLRKSHMSFEWNEFKRAPNVFQVLSAPVDVIFVEVYNEMNFICRLVTSELTSHVRLYKKLEKK